MNRLLADGPAWTRTLAAVVQFVDVFTGLPIRTRFSVSIPALRWTGLWWDVDATYRFSRPNVPVVGSVAQLPTGTFTLSIASADGTYAALEPRQMTLPPAAAHPPPVLVADFLVAVTLWPTVALRTPAGETAIAARLVSATNQSVTGLKARLFDSAAPPPPPDIYTRSDDAGQFLVRLPSLRRGNAANPRAQIDVQVFDVTNAPLAVTPASLAAPIGQLTSFVTLAIP